MTENEYRAQVDAISFSPDFQDRTMARLRELARERENKTMKSKAVRIGLTAAVLAAALCITVFAAVTLLHPWNVARQAGSDALAAAFESGAATAVNETRTVGDYQVTLMGLVSGEGLSRVEQLENAVAQDRTYAVLAYERTDGTAITGDAPDLTVSPLVEGYAPWELNAWTLHGGTHTFAQGGVFYCLLECDDLEPYAGRTVCLAVYPGTHIPPDAAVFDYDEGTGAISVKRGADAALFTLPLDGSRADPQKAADRLNGLRPGPSPQP